MEMCASFEKTTTTKSSKESAAAGGGDNSDANGNTNTTTATTTLSIDTAAITSNSSANNVTTLLMTTTAAATTTSLVSSPLELQQGTEGPLNGIPIPAITSLDEILRNYGPNFKILNSHSQVSELLTIIRDKNTSRSDFKFYADRLIRLVIEESLNQLPYSDCSVETPTGAVYDGLKYQSGNCGVSIIRSGEAMEQGLRDCCRSIRIGKILVESDSDTHAARVVYARFPDDIARRQILLMYPIMSTGNTVLQAVNVLKEHGVPESSIILSNLFCTPMAAECVVSAFPRLKILTSELHPVAPNHFGQKYFGTD